MEICYQCADISHDVQICDYLSSQRKVIADDIVQKSIEDKRMQIRLLKKYRRVLRALNKHERKLQSRAGRKNGSDICWKAVSNSTSHSSDVVKEF
ncbi:MAG: hypothetical protein EOP45_03690 [Sphingobacteriaceae bacterium]|nr:MAG: hypothetical protein EOP45_03690 [Sphingobacteriaceae bacterium]